MIYLLEDDESIRKLVCYALENQGYETRGFAEPAAFEAALAEQRPELVLLDLMLPGEDGISILRRLRSTPSAADVPVIILSARATEYDRCVGLDAGADDYISKPFGMMELVARVRAVLRRRSPDASPVEYRFGSLWLCPDRHEVRVDDAPVSLTGKEFLLLCALVECRGKILSREALLDRVWGLGAERENRTLDVHIRTLRQKLGPAAGMIRTVRGVGYGFSEEAE